MTYRTTEEDCVPEAVVEEMPIPLNIRWSHKSVKSKVQEMYRI